MMCAVVYLYMQVNHFYAICHQFANVGTTFKLFQINEYIIYLASIAWFFAHGLKSVIYLSLNNTIQEDIFKMIALVGWYFVINTINFCILNGQCRPNRIMMANSNGIATVEENGKMANRKNRQMKQIRI